MTVGPRRRVMQGNLQHDAKRFPNRMKHVADYVHSKGLLFGVYTSVGDKTCKGDRGVLQPLRWEQDSRGMGRRHDQNGSLRRRETTLRPRAFGNMSRALNATGRPPLFAVQLGQAKVWEWGAGIAQIIASKWTIYPSGAFQVPTRAPA